MRHIEHTASSRTPSSERLILVAPRRRVSVQTAHSTTIHHAVASCRRPHFRSCRHTKFCMILPDQRQLPRKGTAVERGAAGRVCGTLLRLHEQRHARQIVVVVASVALSSFSAARRERTWCNDKKKKQTAIDRNCDARGVAGQTCCRCAENGHKLEYEAIGGSWLRAEQRE